MAGEMEFFERVLPLPFRAALTIILGVWFFGYDLWILDTAKIDVPALLNLPPRSNPAQPPYYKAVYRFASILTVPLVLSVLVFWILTGLDEGSVARWHWIATGYLVFLGIALVSKKHFITTLGRVMLGGIGQRDNTKFRDILLADALCSCARILGDITLVFMVVIRGVSSTSKIYSTNWMIFIVAFANFTPSIIRMVQCMTVFARTEGSWLDFYNFLKYATAFPPIFIGAARQMVGQGDFMGIPADLLKLLWYISLVVNTAYGLYWDIANDWDLTLFDSARRDRPGMPWGLRQHRYYADNSLYYGTILIDFIGRFAWTWKLMGGRMEAFTDLQMGMWAFELIELYRRAAWVLLRVETEWARSLNNAPIRLESIEL